MNNGEIMGWVSIGVTLLLGLGIFLNSRRANKTGEKKLTLEETLAIEANDDRIATRRLTELNRVYAQVDRLVESNELLSDRVTKLELAREDDATRIKQMEAHLGVVEKMIPVPPGPPARPWLQASRGLTTP
jgi:hypothetical protein